MADFDLIVVGAGPAGLAATAYALQSGRSPGQVRAVVRGASPLAATLSHRHAPRCRAASVLALVCSSGLSGAPASPLPRRVTVSP